MTRSIVAASMSPKSTLTSCAWHFCLLQIGNSLDNALYLKHCCLVCAAVMLSIFSWLVMASWWRRSAAESTPKAKSWPCASSVGEKIEPTMKRNDHIDSSPKPSSDTCCMGAFSISSCKRFRQHNSVDSVLVLSRQDHFTSSEDTGNLTVRDMTSLFRYALLVNTKDFDSTALRRSMSPQGINVLNSMEVAVSASRGSSVELVQTSSHKIGHMDALYFLAVVRIFADWRMRFVPKKYRRYGMSVSLGRRDLIQNIEKAERAVHSWIEVTQLQCASSDTVSGSDDQRLVSPTVEQVLQHEVDVGVHKKLPSVAESSAANGMLWITRQLSYHSNMVCKSLQVPGTYATTREAVEAAYEEVYSSYHGWTTQQIFRRSLQGAPDFSEIMKLLEEDQKGQYLVPNTTFTSPPESCKTPVQLKSPLVCKSSQDPSTYETTPATPKTHSKSPVETFLHGIITDWEKTVAQLSRFNCHDFSNPKSATSGPLHLVDFDLDQNFQKLPMIRVESDVSDSSTEELTATSSRSDDSHPVSFLEQDFADHGKELEVIVRGLQELISDKNMNDPGKV